MTAKEAAAALIDAAPALVEAGTTTVSKSLGNSVATLRKVRSELVEEKFWLSIERLADEHGGRVLFELRAIE